MYGYEALRFERELIECAAALGGDADLGTIDMNEKSLCSRNERKL